VQIRNLDSADLRVRWSGVWMGAQPRTYLGVSLPQRYASGHAKREPALRWKDVRRE